MPLAQTLAERVLVHLRQHPVEPDAADVPVEVTQEGIAAVLAAQVAHVSRALKTLEVRGLVRAHLAHPKGSRRRSRAYSLSDEGRAKASYLEAPAPSPAARPAPPSHPSPGQGGGIPIPAGRAPQAGQLAAALDAAAKGAVRVALVEGDAGMGKSRLLRAFAEDAQRRGARVLAGVGAPTGAEQLVGPLGPALEPLGFERRFRARTAGTPRERALAAAIECIEAAARAEPVVIVLDDLHLAGPSVAEFLHGLVVALPVATRALLVVAFRQEEAWQLPNGPLYTALMPLRSLDGARHVALPPLDAAGIAQLLKDAGATHVPGDLLDRVARESGGNPLYALAMADAMLDGVDEEDFFPATVRALATSRFTGLTASEHAALQAAAVCGPEFDYETLGRVHDGPEPHLLAALDVLLDKLLLEEAPSGGDSLRLRFTHPKVREAVLDEISATRRRWLEGRLAAAAQRT
ncbi:MAG TPA: AAA family ATPase [Candidatus Thermoplasmatota archaeon]|nr:AAA family ATPase [Candidatus Thermoplasmatota archaeon]